MKTNKKFFSNRQYILKFILIFLSLFVAGVIIGSVYSAILNSTYDNSLISYLNTFFQKANDKLKFIEAFKISLKENTRIFLLIFLCSFIKPGALFIPLMAVFRGFVFGFSSSCFIKYYGIKGILICFCTSFSSVLFIPVFIFFCVQSFLRAKNNDFLEKRDKKNYIGLAFCCLTIFCVCSLIDSFFSTTFMKLISSSFTN